MVLLLLLLVPLLVGAWYNGTHSIKQQTQSHRGHYSSTARQDSSLSTNELSGVPYNITEGVGGRPYISAGTAGTAVLAVVGRVGTCRASEVLSWC